MINKLGYKNRFYATLAFIFKYKEYSQRLSDYISQQRKDMEFEFRRVFGDAVIGKAMDEKLRGVGGVNFGTQVPLLRLNASIVEPGYHTYSYEIKEFDKECVRLYCSLYEKDGFTLDCIKSMVASELAKKILDLGILKHRTTEHFHPSDPHATIEFYIDYWKER